jgi:acylphosphatase
LATVIGNDQQVGFRAMIMKQAIEYNLVGSAANEANGIVHFTLQGDSDRLDSALLAGVIVNEFGDVGIDGQLAMPTAETVIEINNGCVCCKVRCDLIGVLGGLRQSGLAREGLQTRILYIVKPSCVDSDLSFRGACVAREPESIRSSRNNSGFRVRRCAAPRNDGVNLSASWY